MSKTRKIRLTRSVMIAGHGACDVGDEFELAPHVAHSLVGVDSAEYIDDAKHPNLEGAVTRISSPEDGDPIPKKLTRQPKPAAKEKE